MDATTTYTTEEQSIIDFHSLSVYPECDKKASKNPKFHYQYRKSIKDTSFIVVECEEIDELELLYIKRDILQIYTQLVCDEGFKNADNITSMIYVKGNIYMKNKNGNTYKFVFEDLTKYKPITNELRKPELTKTYIDIVCKKSFSEKDEWVFSNTKIERKCDDYDNENTKEHRKCLADARKAFNALTTDEYEKLKDAVRKYEIYNFFGVFDLQSMTVDNMRHNNNSQKSQKIIYGMID
jgi:hypothetical protein